MDIKGVLHIGAHFGQEMSEYDKLGLKNVIFFEPLPHTFEILKLNVGNRSIVHNIALGNMTGEIEMNVESANSGMSSSILDPDVHLKQYPWITFNSKVKVKIDKLDEIMKNHPEEQYNFICIDVQGYELEVFKGAINYLNNIDYIITEVNRDEVYKNCARVEQLDEFLKVYNFERVETNWVGGVWGDAFYVKKNKI